ncbi:TPA: type VI secretion system ATPase TssH [Aeromonas salmonicida]|uniref:Type VI secretion system clpB chaperone n=3 Tax=Aeromonas salmonicida TaxID=645 RepID=A4SNM8_AERS4|nr:type VI secretion system ATPase TssH [Aeromonas salmonicida]ABO90500.1 type VI secretion system clpB chaperone [Aeromonas salmonicida subsp. salmonicida A449]AYO63511.1 type VI secretion system ATPase TssH [Aeromonas salmonicida subsp. salmonicida 01-B526]EHI54018.1 type VI secretion system clpB chaperone [Aeromonas salmonicida subsp. salmonicida 01-B526]EKP0238353.1 type VI secretion system ATPase TssH [Aeromonas salmonicida]EKP0242535.1 type VI secretion system ATPase TssH [Aeromonas salm
MIRIELPVLVERLNPICRHMLEEAAALCVNHQGAEIRIEHLLLKMLDTPLSDVRQILKRADVGVDELKTLLQPAGADSGYAQGYPSFSPLLVEWLQDSWLLASAELQHAQLRSGVMLLVLLMTPQRYLPGSVTRLLANVNRELLRQQFDEWVKESAETQVTVSTNGTSTQAALPADASLLARFTINVTEQARQGSLDPVLCRDHEIDLMIDILSRRRKNNPIVVGEAGVGKSALIEGLALRIVADQVPEKLREVELMTLDLGAMQAGASVKGEFEKRFKGVMQEVKEAVRPVILFIDEAHTLIGAGNQAGGLDVSNLIKPALARGELRTIAATTWGEYKKYVEKDAALSRRFQLVKVGEPNADEATVILRGLRSIYEKAHGVLIDEEALQAATQLSARYISGRQLPDKAIDVLDTACARVAINLTTPPRAVSHLQNALRQRELEIRQLERQSLIGLGDNTERLAELQSAQQTSRDALREQEAKWQQQQGLVHQIVELRAALLADQQDEMLTREALDLADAPLDPQAAAEQLAGLERELAELQQGEVLVSAHVDKTQVAAVIAEWTGVPLNRISQGELDVVTRLPEYLGELIKGLDVAVAHLHKHLLTARADLRRPGRPLGAFLLVGPSGVGKTETVLQIAELMFGGRQYLTTINMSEYQEKHTVSRLIGSPPGYVGFGEGGVLTEAIRQKPYSVVLLDEVEKAHPDVLNLFYQAFDKGELADGEGRIIDCKNVVFFLTSNLGFQTIVDYAEQPDDLLNALYPELAAFFKPALLARMEVIPYLPLGHDTLVQIVGGKLNRLVKLLKERFGAEVVLEDEVAEEILRRANRSENGARMLESVIDGALLPPVSLQLLQRLSAGEPIKRVRFSVSERQFVAEVEG